MMQKIVEEVLAQRKNGHQFNANEVEEIAGNILNAIQYTGDEPVPIVSIAKQMGFKMFHIDMERNLSGFIGIGAFITKNYGHDKVICININDELGHQRFVLAHELSHFLFDYDAEISEEFYDTYVKNSHKPPREQIANRFAASLLMPKKQFAEIMQKNGINEGTVKILKDKFVVQDKAVLKRMLEV